MSAASAFRIELNGAPAGVDDLRHLVQTNYGHFSAMRVEDRAVRGLDLHFERIEQATRELFGAAVARERVRECLRHAVGSSDAPVALRINVFARALNRERPAASVDADILVTIGPPAQNAPPALRVKSFAYARELPHIKHVGTFPLFHYRRLAQQAGFDDAVFTYTQSNVSEGSIWNVGFFDGAGIVWPDAPQLAGVSLQLLDAGLRRAGWPSARQRVAAAELGRFRSAFFTNSSTPVCLLACIDDTAFALDRELEARLVQAYQSNPPQPL